MYEKKKVYVKSYSLLLIQRIAVQVVFLCMVISIEVNCEETVLKNEKNCEEILKNRRNSLRNRTVFGREDMYTGIKR